AGERRIDRDATAEEGTSRVTIVECQWWERAKVAVAIDLTTGEETEMEPEQGETLARRANVLAMPVQVVHRIKRRYRRAFIG
ncbi:hypothetical protein ACU6QR_00340, partial [Aeromonas veronii]